MPAKRVKIETPEECLRLWKAELVIDSNEIPWTEPDLYEKRATLSCEEAAIAFLDIAYVLVESD